MHSVSINCLNYQKTAGEDYNGATRRLSEALNTRRIELLNATSQPLNNNTTPDVSMAKAAAILLKAAEPVSRIDVCDNSNKSTTTSNNSTLQAAAIAFAMATSPQSNTPVSSDTAYNNVNAFNKQKHDELKSQTNCSQAYINDGQGNSSNNVFQNEVTQGSPRTCLSNVAGERHVSSYNRSEFNVDSQFQDVSYSPNMPNNSAIETQGTRGPSEHQNVNNPVCFLENRPGGGCASSSDSSTSAHTPKRSRCSSRSVGHDNEQSIGTEVHSRKREQRLIKNREAARECRRKKKEYLRCLENRVAILESQNQQLINELKRMKSFCCSQPTSTSQQQCPSNSSTQGAIFNASTKSSQNEVNTKPSDSQACSTPSPCYPPAPQLPNAVASTSSTESGKPPTSEPSHPRPSSGGPLEQHKYRCDPDGRLIAPHHHARLAATMAMADVKGVSNSPQSFADDRAAM